MSHLIAVTQGQAVAWICFVVGVVVLFGGVAVGLWTSFKYAPKKTREAKAKLDEASAKLDRAKAHIEVSRSAAAASNLESMDASATEAVVATEAAAQSTDEAKSAFEQVQSIIASLPENLRFAGLLVLVGTLLMSVATIQFGGVSLF